MKHKRDSPSPRIAREKTRPTCPPSRLKGDANNRVLDSRFRLLDVLGVGGSATVYRAWDQELNIEVALKWLDVGESWRVRREVLVARDATHSGILPIHEFGEAEGRPYFVMPIAQGGTLSDWIRDHGRLPFPTVLEIAREVLTSLSSLHKKNLVHRDIKPSNIFHDGKGRWMLGDFGVVLDPNSTRMTQTATPPGTLSYMPPEVQGGAEQDPSGDLWALGLTLQQALGGRDHSVPVPTWFHRWLKGLANPEPKARFPDARSALIALNHHRGRFPRRWPIAGMILILGVGGAWQFRPHAKHFSPIAAHMEGHELVAQDATGHELWRANGPYKVAKQPILLDLDGDGHNEVVVAGAWDATSKEWSGTLSIFSPKGVLLNRFFGSAYRPEPLVCQIEAIKGPNHRDFLFVNQRHHLWAKTNLYVFSGVGNQYKCCEVKLSNHPGRVVLHHVGFAGNPPRPFLAAVLVNNPLEFLPVLAIVPPGKNRLSAPFTIGPRSPGTPNNAIYTPLRFGIPVQLKWKGAWPIGKAEISFEDGAMLRVDSLGFLEGDPHFGLRDNEAKSEAVLRRNALQSLCMALQAIEVKDGTLALKYLSRAKPHLGFDQNVLACAQLAQSRAFILLGRLEEARVPLQKSLSVLRGLYGPAQTLSDLDFLSGATSLAIADLRPPASGTWRSQSGRWESILRSFRIAAWSGDAKEARREWERLYPLGMDTAWGSQAAESHAWMGWDEEVEALLSRLEGPVSENANQLSRTRRHVALILGQPLPPPSATESDPWELALEGMSGRDQDHLQRRWEERRSQKAYDADALLDLPLAGLAWIRSLEQQGEFAKARAVQKEVRAAGCRFQVFRQPIPAP